MKKLISILIFIPVFSVSAQTISLPEMDSLLQGDQTEFKLDDLYLLVLKNHPVAKQADLLSEQAMQEIRLARGSFDPKLATSFNIKKFQEKEYYNLLNSSLKIPVWFPIDPKVSLDRNRGVFLNPENSIPQENNYMQLSAGVSLPLGKGLFIDERRAAVKQAVIFQDILEADQLIMINDVLLDATVAYWKWYYDYYNYVLVERSLLIAEQIYERVKLNFQFGEAAVVDTIQAHVTLQNRRIDLQDTRNQLVQSRLKLSLYIWGENEEPLELKENVMPVVTREPEYWQSAEFVTGLKERAQEYHPYLEKLILKREQFEVKNRLNRENLKPQVDLAYNLIDTPFNVNGETPSAVFSDNYKFGIEFSFPLFLRKERAKVGLNQLKIKELDYEMSQKRQKIANEIEGISRELGALTIMFDQQSVAVNSYENLLKAELLNLDLGESNLFQINYQQDQLIAAQSKLILIRSKYEINKSKLLWAAGVPNLVTDTAILFGPQ